MGAVVAGRCRSGFCHEHAATRALARKVNARGTRSTAAPELAATAHNAGPTAGTSRFGA